MSHSVADRPLLALLLRLLGIGGFAAMAVLIKLADDTGVHLLEIIFWRQFVSVPIVLAWAAMAGGMHLIRTDRPKAHAVRAGYGIVGMVLNFGGVILLPLAEATALSFSAPIFAVILSIVLLKETVGSWRWSAVIAGFAGILVIAQPGGNDIPLFGAMVALGGAFMIALISIQIRDLGRTDHPVAIVFWFAVATVIVALPALFFVHEPLTAQQWLLLLGIGITGTWGQVLITLALRYGTVSSVIVMDYSNLIWATLLGWIVFSTVPPVTTWLGAPLVIGAGLLITWRERVLSRQRAAIVQGAGGT
ncbi:DMT family transporter [Aurantiacibacter aquimixticola]|uniref:DMT family transporter n=1 Tax=Aurantiacibacter aquimixticola TaxID=1958945 RepID=A0A419RQZ2_9SPHN|nr:DMT family transporter [Aurantiacibacter aquimixticola]RJY08232.1 DMT family transporter [Aurantiacibacter aquimixticola]